MTFASDDPIPVRIATIRQTLPPQVRLIAVTKQVSLAAMREAYAAGVRDFGENRVQDLATKRAHLQDLTDVTWHLIGHLQSNKALLALELATWIHSVDSLKLAQRLDRLVGEHGLPKPNLCLQVKLRPDPSKYGWAVTDLLASLPALNDCQNLAIAGLMTIPPQGLSSAEISQIFHETRNLSTQIQQQYWPNLTLGELSLGMSNDYQLALEAGATMIRLGRILFGDRPSQTVSRNN
jgi:hypothetical protein